MAVTGRDEADFQTARLAIANIMLINALVLAAAAALATSVHAQSAIEPPAGRLYLSAWLDTTDSRPGAGDGDRPKLLNGRLGFELGSVQYGQPIPIVDYPFPIEQVEATGNNAVIVLSVNPEPSPWTITDKDISTLTEMCGRINSQGRRILLRFGPEMNGNWKAWGQQPTAFVALWRRVHAALRRDAPQTALVWGPSSGNGYPYRTITPTTVSAADFALLDTTKDGVVDAKDDPYSPYYPGDEFVDWIGMSVYYYGPTFPWQDNTIAPPGRVAQIISIANFYQTYAVTKNKPLMLSESASAFHINSPTGPGVGELATKQSWWRQYITNATFLDAFPRIKLISLFEFRKFEETEILNAFKQDFAAVKARYVEAVPLAPSGTVAGGAPAPGTGGNTTKNAAHAVPAPVAVGLAATAAVLAILMPLIPLF
ncbi:glycoside hydrolase superfamily [Entophlyctis helioformis]|nr:glycoside hydrolase superfamily [Entophlyctis helioformis]